MWWGKTDSSFLEKKGFKSTWLSQKKNKLIPHGRPSSSKPTNSTTTWFSAQVFPAISSSCVSYSKLPGSEQRAKHSADLHSTQSGTTPRLSGRRRWPEAPCGKSISHLAAHGSFLGISSAGEAPHPMGFRTLGQRSVAARRKKAERLEVRRPCLGPSESPWPQVGEGEDSGSMWEQREL